MSESPLNPHLQNRRSFLCSLASVGLATNALAFTPRHESENVYRILTPECEVRMSVEYFGNSEINSLRFRDFLTRRTFSISADGQQNRDCPQRFAGSVAIAHYHFRSRLHSPLPLNIRERVLTIDHDSRMDPRPPFEKLLALERDTVSDIQAFGYDPDNAQPAPRPVWCLLRQDLFLNDQSTAFLIVHWKHTFDEISLVDVIPGDRTQLANA